MSFIQLIDLCYFFEFSSQNFLMNYIKCSGTLFARCSIGFEYQYWKLIQRNKNYYLVQFIFLWVKVSFFSFFHPIVVHKSWIHDFITVTSDQLKKQNRKKESKKWERNKSWNKRKKTPYHWTHWNTTKPQW